MCSYRLFLAALCGLPLGGAAACSGDDDVTSTADASTDAPKTPNDGEPEEDAAAEAAVVPVVLPSCVGTALAMEIDGRRAHLDVTFGYPVDAGPDADASTGPLPKGPYIVDFGTTSSTIDLEAFEGAKPQPTYCDGDAAAPGAFCTFQGFDFFGDWGSVVLRTDTYATLFGTKRQAGIIATDFLSNFQYTLDYANKRIFKATPDTFCADGQLLASGFRPLSTKGFYTSDLKTLRPLADVLQDPDGGTANFTVPNVPTVPIAIAGVDALAQLDTGYEDRLVPHSINVNRALFDKIEAKDFSLLQRDPKRDIFVTTCVPYVSEAIEAYALKTGQTFDFIAEGGSVARKETTVEIYLKKSTPETKKCGGIGTWTVPAAQIGSSFYVDMQAIVFDPKASRVWVPKN